MSSTRSRSTRDDHWKHVEAIERIFAERLVRTASSRLRFVAAMMRASQPDRLRAAEAFDDARLLEHAQQLDLHLHRRLTNLVEKQRGLMRGFEAPDLARQRAGERAALAPNSSPRSAPSESPRS